MLAVKSGVSDLLSVKGLFLAKRLALRRHVWFKVLSRVERGIIDLTVKCVDSIKSTRLAKVLTAIMQKLAMAAEGMLDRLVRTVGFSLARKVSGYAQGWGNRLASRWAVDARFAKYLAVLQFNSGVVCGLERGRV